MGNLIYDNDFFNPDVKNRYLSDFDEPTQTTIGRIFKRSFYFESDLNKDLYLFNIDELRNLLKNLTPKNSIASRVNASLISSYMEWSIEEGYRDNNMNPLRNLDLSWHEELVDKSKKTLFTEDEISEVVDHLVNAQDAVIIQLLFEGAAGGIQSAELCNLTRRDVDEDNNRILLRDGNGRERRLTVSDKCMSLIRRAINETAYQKSNGLVSATTKSPEVKLHDNDCVIRNSVARGSANGKVDYFTIKRRTSMAGSLFDYTTFTPSNIAESGMLKIAKDLLATKGSLDNEDYEAILERFGAHQTLANGKMMYNFYIPKRRFLNEDRIKEVYGDEAVK